MEGEENKEIKRGSSQATQTTLLDDAHMVSEDVKRVPEAKVELKIEPEDDVEPNVEPEDELQVEPDVETDVEPEDELQPDVVLEEEHVDELGDESMGEPGEFLRPLLASLSLLEVAPFPASAYYFPRLPRLLQVLRRPGPPYAVWMGLLQARLHDMLRMVVSASGIQDEPVLGRAYYCGLILPASVDLKTSVAYVAWEGEVSQSSVFEVLIVLRGTVEWMRARDGDVPAQAFPVGLGLDCETVYVARVFRSGRWRLGRVMPSEGACMVVEEGNDIAYSEYEVLVITCP